MRSVLLATALTLLPLAAAAADHPLYAAFLDFCVATHGDPALTRSAVEKIGGHATPIAGADYPQMAGSWAVQFHGRSMTVIAGASVTLPEGGVPALGISDCIIVFQGAIARA